MLFDLKIAPLIFLLLVFTHTASSQQLPVIEDLPGFPGKLPFKLQTGYIGVGKSEEVQLFYYFVESERNPEKDPLMLWLAGGPGCSGFSSLVYEIGPLIFDYANSRGSTPTLTLNPYSWTKVTNIIFLDQPVGTGFSYAATPEAYISSDTLATQHIYQFLNKWLVIHPNFVDNPFYIGGVSYAGIYIPQVLSKIFDGIDIGSEPLMNIKGYLMGNPVILYGTPKEKFSFAHRMGLLSDDLYQSAKDNCNENFTSSDPDNVLCQNDLQRIDRCLNRIREQQILEPWCESTTKGPRRLMSSSSYILDESPANDLQAKESNWCREDNYVYSEIWANNKSVQQALHIRQGTIKEWVRCNSSFSYKSAKHYTFNVNDTSDYHRSFTYKDCKALIYSGDHDMIVPHISTKNWIASLTLPLKSDWRPWFAEDQVAGYTKTYVYDDYELTYATVKGGGHTAPEYKPMECLDMIERWLNHSPL